MARSEQGKKRIANPGATLGQAIGEHMERALGRALAGISDRHGCHYLGTGPLVAESAKRRQLNLQDEFGTKYRLDAVIANADLQPLVLLESKYIRYAKHNRDKGSWICHTHQTLRRRYYSVRKSIAVLAGTWTGPSVAMMRSADVDVFLIPFERICDLLQQQQIDFRWAEDDRDSAVHAWRSYDALPEAAKKAIGEDMLDGILADLSETVDAALNDSAPPKIADVVIEFRAAAGEILRQRFDSTEEAIAYLDSADAGTIFSMDRAPRVNDLPATQPEGPRHPRGR